MKQNATLSAREIAARILVRIEQDGAFAAAVLDVELARAVQLSERDRAFATELVYGTLRAIRYIDERLSNHTDRGFRKLDIHVLSRLRIAAYQLLFLSRTPAFAAVNECVTAIRALRGPRLAGFANAVLRKLAADGTPANQDAWIDALPDWLRERLIKILGQSAARMLVGEPGSVPPACLVVPNPNERDAIAHEIEASIPDVRIEVATHSPHGLRIWNAGALTEHACVREGRAYVQEEGSQLVALLAGVRSGDRILDACAGRGHKSVLLAYQAGPLGTVDVADLHDAKLNQLASAFSRLGFRFGERHVIDWSVGCGTAKACFYDIVLVDAPCTGTGTIRRRPDILLRRKAADIDELATLQSRILANAARCVREGGRLVYAVCSVLEEESNLVCEEFSNAHPLFVREPSPPLGTETTHGVLLHPLATGTDGYFVAAWRRRST